MGPRGSFTYFYHAFPSPVCPCLVLLHDTVSLLKHRNSSTPSEDFLLCLLPFHMDHIDAGLLLMHIRVIAFNALELRKVFKRWSGPDIANWQLLDQIWPINLLIFLVVLKKKKVLNLNNFKDSADVSWLSYCPQYSLLLTAGLFHLILYLVPIVIRISVLDACPQGTSEYWQRKITSGYFNENRQKLAKQS